MYIKYVQAAAESERRTLYEKTIGHCFDDRTCPFPFRLRRLLLAAGGSEQQDPDGQAQSSHFLFHSVKPFLKNSDGIIAPFGGVDNWQKGWDTEINFEHKHSGYSNHAQTRF